MPRLRGPWGKRLRRLAAAKALVLALSHVLGERGVLLRTEGEAARAPEVGRVQVGDLQGWVVPTWVFQGETVEALQRGVSPESIMASAPWLLRESSEARARDLLFFGLVLAPDAPRRAEARKAKENGQPLTVVHWLPSRWQQPRGGLLSPFVFKTEHPFSLRLHGLNRNGQYARYALALRGGEVARVHLPWQGVYALEANAWPQGRVGLKAAGLGIHVVSPEHWENIAIYGREIWLLGFTTWREFWRRARYVRRGERSFPHGTHFEPAYLLPWCALEPLRAL